MINDKEKRYMKHYFGLVLLCLLTACGGTTKKTEQQVLVKVDTVKQASQLSNRQYPGKVKAAQDISLAFRVSGTLMRIAVEDGARVRQGQLLAELDPTDYQVQLEATEAEYRQIKADAERVMGLYADSATTASQYDKAVYGLKQITAKYRHHQDQLSYTRLYAPFDGYVQKHLFEAHETVGAGMPVMAMIGGSEPEVEINLPAAEYIRREQFSSYHCTFQIFPGELYPLKLISITPKANANQLYTMRLLIECKGKPLPSPGMNTMVTILSEEQEGELLSVPNTALFEEDNQSYLYRYIATDGRIHRTKVEPVRPLSNGRIIIRSTGVEAGDEIIATGVHHLQEGDKVTPMPAPTATNVGQLL